MSHIFPVGAPYPFFTDLTGGALDGGKIYIGVAGLDAETNPINAYWDDDLTVVAVQPIRTVVGLPDNGGTPSKFFAATDFSITVRDVNDQLMYSKLSVDDTDEPDPDVFDPEPLALLYIGASNAAINANATGGNRVIPEDVFAWNSNQHAATGLYVPGTEFNQAEFGSLPLNAASGQANSLALQTAINLKNITNRPVYFVILAMGGTHPESFIPETVRIANGWTIQPGDEDLTLYYPNLRSALAEIPGGKDSFDFVGWYGTAGASDGKDIWQPKFSAVLDAMESENLGTKALSQTVAFTTAPGRATRDVHQQAISDESIRRPNLGIVNTQGASLADASHYDGDGLTRLGRQGALGLMGGNKPSVSALYLADETDGDVEAFTFLEALNGDTFQVTKFGTDGFIRYTLNSNLGQFKVESNDTVTTEEILDWRATGLSILGGAQRLEKYDRGQATLEIADASTGGNTATIGTNQVRYEVVGRTCLIYGEFIDIDTTGMTGGNDIFIRGLPFTVVGQGIDIPGAVELDTFTLTGGYTSVVARANQGTDYISLMQNGSGVASLPLTVASISSGVSDIRGFSIAYRINDPLAP